jgi:hypothetical protein
MKVVDGSAGVSLAGGVIIVPQFGRRGRLAGFAINAPDSHPVTIRGTGLYIEVLMPETVTKWYVSGKLFGTQIQPIECDTEEQCKSAIQSICLHLVDPKVHAALQYGSAEVEVTDGSN